MFRHRLQALGLVVVLCMLVAPLSYAAGPVSLSADAPADLSNKAAQTSHRLIVELASPPLATWHKISSLAQSAGGRLNVQSVAAQEYVNRLRAEQAAFVSTMETVLPAASVSTYIDEHGTLVDATYQVVLNGMAIDVGDTDRDRARRVLAKLPGVKRVTLDYAHTPDVYTSTALIGAPVAWSDPAIGGQANAGAGIKVASMDGGLHKDAPMFDGTGYDYPPGFPEGGLGLMANNNGKIIASRTYFRTWDPPAPGDANPWPGTRGTSHGCHTSGIAAGNVVTGSYLGLEFPMMSGVAPAAWLMSYRVFYNSITGDGSFYTAEGIAALEDIVMDGADVLNNSWGGGPGSLGGEFDALDTALINAAQAGIFVAMSAGNAGPGLGTTDHPSDDYINVAASTTSGTLASGRAAVIAPVPTVPALRNIPFGIADFGAPLPLAETLTYTCRTAMSVDPTNVTGCEPWEGTPFAGEAAIISRGACYFSDKVRNAQQAGAEFAVIYNNQGEGLITMACGDDCSDITIPSIFIGQTPGEGMVDWYAQYGEESVLEIDTHAFQAGNTPDVIVAFSSRGPGVGNVLKPDIAAPGSNILSQGYTPGAIAEGRHLGYGQASGTSMAAPHVTGAAALLRQIHPAWSNAYIKSALMSTAKYLEVYNRDDSPAQPLDMGAGRLDLTHAADPGVILNPPSLSFGVVLTGTSKTIEVTVTSVADETETYQLSTLYTGDGFDETTSLPGFNVGARSITLEPGASTTFMVTIDSTMSAGLGDNQGYIVLRGESYEAHMPAWARVLPPMTDSDILIIDNDASTTLDFPDYAGYYTRTVEALGYTYELWDADAHYGHLAMIPDATTLSTYKAIIYFTGDNFYPNGSFAVSTPLSELDMNRLTEYANGGGALIAMGQDMASVLNSAETDGAEFFYGAVLGGNYLQDSVTGGITPTLPIMPTGDAPLAMHHIKLDVSDVGDGAGNQIYIDEIAPKPVKAPDNPEELRPYVPILKYPGAGNMRNGVVAIAHRDQPSFERPGVSYEGASILTTFGLEGVNNTRGSTSREGLLYALLSWAWDKPVVGIAVPVPPRADGLTVLQARVTSETGATGVRYRWDFGDGSGYFGPYESDTASHRYEGCGPYTVRVEATDSFGNRVIASRVIRVCEFHPLFLPAVQS